MRLADAIGRLHHGDTGRVAIVVLNRQAQGAGAKHILAPGVVGAIFISIERVELRVVPQSILDDF